MSYVVTEADIERAWATLSASMDGHVNGFEYAFGDPEPMRNTLEQFAQTLGEPVPVPGAMEVRDIRDPFFTGSTTDAYANGWNACREAMLYAAPHHPTTEKGCE